MPELDRNCGKAVSSQVSASKLSNLQVYGLTTTEEPGSFQLEKKIIKQE